MKKQFSRTSCIIWWIIINAIFSVVVCFFYNNDKLYLIIAYIGTIQLIIAVLLNYKKTGQIFSAYTVFLIITYSFLFGQCIMWIVTENYSGRNIINIYTKDQVIKAQIFTLLGLFFLNMGTICVKNQKNKKIPVQKQQLLLKAQRNVGFAILGVSIIPEIIYNVRRFILAFTYGYMGIYQNQLQGIFSKILNLREFFFPAVILIIVSNTKKIKLNTVLILLVLLDTIIGLYVGSRADALLQIVTIIILVYIINNKENKRKNILKYIIIAYVLMFIINVIAQTRITPNKTVRDFGDVVKFSNGQTLLVNTLGEMGTSMSTCIETMTLVPETYNYRYGTTYLLSFTWLIPEQLTGGINISEKYASMNTWIDNIKYTGSGWGFSTTAEAYINFGYLGIIIFFAIGLLAGKFFNNLNEDKYQNNPVEFSLCFIIFSRLLIFGRIDFLSAVPTIFYFYIVIKLAIYIYYRKIEENT